MTERLYYHDAALRSFDGVAVAHGADSRQVILDRTAFYPTSGGQPHDTGTLNGVRVIDVIDDDDRIVHVLDAPLPLGPVHGEIDAVRRHDQMQQHTAQHLLSALAASRFGWETTSVHFGTDHSTIEFDTAAASDTELHDLESLANAAVVAAHPVTAGFEAAAEAIVRGLRKPPARSGVIRVVTIENLDRSACGGTHLSSTAAIGVIVLQGAERIRGHVRTSFLAGDRVIARVHARETLLAKLAEVMSCATGELAGMVEKRQAEFKGQRERIEALEREVAVARLRALVATSTTDANGVRWVVHQGQDESPTLLRTMAQAVATLDRVLFVATLAMPPTVFFASGPGTGVDAGSILKETLATLGGRGGGSPRAGQGTVASSEALPGAVDLLIKRVHDTSFRPPN